MQIHEIADLQDLNIKVLLLEKLQNDRDVDIK